MRIEVLQMPQPNSQCRFMKASDFMQQASRRDEGHRIHNDEARASLTCWRPMGDSERTWLRGSGPNVGHAFPNRAAAGTLRTTLVFS